MAMAVEVPKPATSDATDAGSARARERAAQRPPSPAPDVSSVTHATVDAPTVPAQPIPEGVALADLPSAHAEVGSVDKRVLGARLGRYQVERRIGRGGMGAVYRARHVDLGHAVAIKVIDGKRWTSPDALARFFQEAKAAAQIGHPNIVRVYDFERHPVLGAYIVMELLEGETLGHLLGRVGPLEECRALEIVLQVCDAVGAAHRRDVIHRDIKPENLFLTAGTGGESVKVMDFGVAKIAEPIATIATQPGAILGTPRYMSPQQLDGRDIDRRADVYSVGAVLYEMVTGEPPVHGETFTELVRAHALDKLVPPRKVRPSLSQELDRAVLRCLEKEPQERFSSMEELAATLRPLALRASGSMNTVARAESPLPRKRALALVAGAVGLGIATAGLLAIRARSSDSGAVPSKSVSDAGPGVDASVPDAVPPAAPDAMLSAAVVLPDAAPPKPKRRPNTPENLDLLYGK